MHMSQIHYSRHELQFNNNAIQTILPTIIHHHQFKYNYKYEYICRKWHTATINIWNREYTDDGHIAKNAYTSEMKIKQNAI